MADLKFLWHDITRTQLELNNITKFIAGTTGTTDEPAVNLFGGDRALKFKRGAIGTTAEFDFNLGSGSVRAIFPQYTVLSRVNLTIGSDDLDPNIPNETVRVDVFGADDAAFTAPDQEMFFPELSQLVGPNNDDFIIEHSFVTDRRFWRYRITTINSVLIELGKIISGKFFEFNRDPSTPATITSRRKNPKNRREIRIFELTFEGITDAKCEEFYNNIFRFRQFYPVMLYVSGRNELLDNETLLHCIVRNWSVEPRTPIDNNRVRISFEEII